MYYLKVKIIIDILSRLIKSSFTPLIKDTCEKIVKKVNDERLNKLKEILSYFNESPHSLTESCILCKLVKESFFKKIFINILLSDYSNNPDLVVDKLIKYFNFILELSSAIEETIFGWDTPTGPPDEMWVYELLVPKLRNLDGQLYFDNNNLDYSWFNRLNKKLSQILYDEEAIKSSLYVLINKLHLFKYSRPNFKTLDNDTVIQIIKENFQKGSVRDVFQALKAILKSGYIEGLKLKDFLFDFLNEKDAKIFQEIDNSIQGGVKIFCKYFPSDKPGVYKSAQFDHNKNIIAISFREIYLEKLTDSLLNLENLEMLDLSHNNLKTLPISIGNLKKLKTLDLEYNNLNTLPESIGDLISLKKLILNHNNLKTLPKSIIKLTLLKELDLRKNQFTTFPESIKILKKKGVRIYK